MRKRLILILLVIVMLIPWSHVGVSDGGTEIYTSALYQVTLQHTMHWEGECFGYLKGTKVRLLFFEVYNDIQFVPSEENISPLPVPEFDIKREP